MKVYRGLNEARLNCCVAGNYAPVWTTEKYRYQVLCLWPEKLWKQRKIPTEVCKEYLHFTRDGVPARKRNLEIVEQEEERQESFFSTTSDTTTSTRWSWRNDSGDALLSFWVAAARTPPELLANPSTPESVWDTHFWLGQFFWAYHFGDWALYTSMHWWPLLTNEYTWFPMCWSGICNSCMLSAMGKENVKLVLHGGQCMQLTSMYKHTHINI